MGNRFSKMLLNFFFPNCCPFCDEIIEYDAMFCNECLSDLPLCSKSKGMVIENDGARFLSFSAFYYEKGADKAVKDLKFNNCFDVVERLSEYMAEAVRNKKEIEGIDYIIPVPMHKRDRRRRGFNQSEFLAGAVSKRLNIPLKKDLLIKTKRTKKQHELNATQRALNLKDAFAVSSAAKNGKDIISGKSVLLIDDVLTTGATAAACVMALSNAGVSKTVLLTATKTHNFSIVGDSAEVELLLADENV